MSFQFKFNREDSVRFKPVLVVPLKPTFIKRTIITSYRAWKALYKCNAINCGNVFEAQMNNVNSGNTISCGCYQRLSIRHSKHKHGHSLKNNHSKTYSTWEGMHRRCSNPNEKFYPEYGGRGIKVCEKWSGEKGFENFLKDMKEKPNGTSIERINNSEGYYRANCIWATRTAQNRNRRNTRKVMYRNELLPLAQVVEVSKSKLSYNVIATRLNKGWDLEIALHKPIDLNRSLNRLKGNKAG